MHIVRFANVPSYIAPGHDRMRMVRLQGREAGPTDTLWLGVSVIAPGGGTALDASNVEKLYVVFNGTLTVSNGHTQVELGRWDSCRIAPGESRRLHNASAGQATVRLAMPYAPGKAT